MRVYVLHPRHIVPVKAGSHDAARVEAKQFRCSPSGKYLKCYANKYFLTVPYNHHNQSHEKVNPPNSFKTREQCAVYSLPARLHTMYRITFSLPTRRAMRWRTRDSGDRRVRAVDGGQQLHTHQFRLRAR